MTVSSQTNKVIYIGNGVAKEFAIPFSFLEQEHIKVRQKKNDIQTERTDWTVKSGNLVFADAPESGAEIAIVREVPLTQETDYRDNEILHAETLERNSDKLTMQVQQLAEKEDRAVTVDIFDDTQAAELIPSIRKAVSDCQRAVETAEENGISHFIEHMVFKGTSSRSCEDIARESDIMGGQLNAFTSKEYTCFYSRCLYEHVGRTLSLLCDMVCNSLLDPRDIETEKGVVLEEIGMYEDSPEDCCSDKLTALSFKGHPMGFNILGTRDTVSSFSADTLRQYMAKNYVPERIVISICGRFEKSEVLEIITSCFGGLKNTNNPAVIVECGFISNGEECKNLLDSQYQKQMAFSITAGFLSYYNTD